MEEGVVMLLGDKDIQSLIRNGVLKNAKTSHVGPVSYDLETQSFYRDGESSKTVVLNPGDSVFVSSVEDVYLTEDIAARVLIKNSRLRQGLTLDAPLYFPGHETKLFFRVTNISSDLISLDTDKGIAQVIFEQVDDVERPYDGAFSGEFSFKGLADYTDIYKSEIEKIDQKKDELKSMEHRLYANILALMAIFAAIFTLVNINAGALGSGSVGIVTVNLIVLGGFMSLAGVIGLLVGTDAPRGKSIAVLVIGLILMAASALI